jgi:hypothetical protein
MKRDLLKILILILLISGCVKRSNTNKIIDFESYINAIPFIEFPYNTSCGSCCSSIKLNIDSSFISKYNLDGLEVIGKLVDNDKYVAILYAGAADYFVPGLVIFSKRGEKISEKNFFGNSCGQILDYYGNSTLEIDEQLQITEIDSSLKFKMDTINFKVIDTLSEEIKILIYKIDKDGKIITTPANKP